MHQLTSENEMNLQKNLETSKKIKKKKKKKKRGSHGACSTSQVHGLCISCAWAGSYHGWTGHDQRHHQSPQSCGRVCVMLGRGKFGLADVWRSDGLTMAGLVSRCLEVHVVTRRSKSERYKEEAGSKQLACWSVKTPLTNFFGTRETVVGAGHDRIEERCHKVTGGRR